MKVKVMSMRRMLGYKQTDWNCGKIDGVISIRTPIGGLTGIDYPFELDVNIDRITPNKLVIECHDVTAPNDQYIMFSSKHALQIIDFVKGKHHILIHCDAGMSRSVAVGAFFRDFYDAEVGFLEGFSDKFRNVHVYSTLRREMYHPEAYCWCPDDSLAPHFACPIHGEKK